MTENDDFDNTSWDTPNQYWADISLALFFEGSIDAPPMADEGTWYSVDAYVNDSNRYTVGQAYTEICMANGSVCEDDMVDNNTDLWAEEMFDEVDADGDGAINGTELINHENLMRSENNESPMNTSEETELLDAMADYDTGFTSADGDDTEDANDGMLEFNEFMEFFYNEFMSNEFTDYDLYYMDDGDNRTLEIQINDGGDYGYATVSLANMENEVYNTTFNTTFWTLDLHANSLYENIYFLTISIYDTMGDIIYMSGDTLGEMDYEQMVFDMYDNNSDGVISWEEYSLFLMDTDTDWDEDEEEHFDMVDKDGDGAVNSSELIYYENSLLIENDEPVMDADEESELLAEMADYDIGWESEDGPGFEDAGDGMLEFNEFMNYENGYSSMDNMSFNLFKGMFLSQDVNGDGGLDIDEFSSFMGLMMDIDDDDSGYSEMELMMVSLDTNQDGNISLAEILSTMVEEDDPDYNSEQMTTFFTNMFNNEDVDGNALLDADEFAVFFRVLEELDGEDCYEVMVGDAFMEEGEFEDEEGNYNYYMVGDTAPSNGTYCIESEMNFKAILYMIDTDGDDSVSMVESVNWMKIMKTQENEEPLSEIEIEFMGDLFKMADADNNEKLDASEFLNFINAMGSQEDHNDDDHQGGENNMGTEDDSEDIQFDSIDVWFEQWNDGIMELVLVELAVIDNAEDIERLSMMADSMYGNNDTVLDESEVKMLMTLYRVNLNVDDIADGLTLDGQNGTAVDYWVEIDGLLEGDDVVFIRVGTVIEFKVEGTYQDSTTHTFVVDNSDESEAGNMNESNNDATCDDNVRVHNSESWKVSTVTTTGNEMVFTYEDTNDMWIGDNDNCHSSGVITFNLDKVENGVMPVEEDDDWTWEEEEMNLLPICDWHYAVTFANGSMMGDQWMEEAPVSGDYMITLIDDASYEISVNCKDPEEGKMTVDITSSLGNSSNTSIGHAMGYIVFKLPAGTGGNVTFDVTWTDGYHTESGTLTVYATGDGTTDLSDIEVAESEGLLPGFTVGLGVVAMLGAAMIAGRRNEA